MPNTLVHLGVQSVSTKALFREADFKWIALGCIIPDIPWIINRIIILSGIGIPQYDLTQYVSVQASLFFCLLLCGAIALLCLSPTRMFLLLAMNVLVHLLLDAMQIKWANGVHFFAPFSWQMTRFDLFWPEHRITYLFTAAGLGALVYFGVRDWKREIVLNLEPVKYVSAVLLLSVYFILPFWLRFGPDQADNHFTVTLSNIEERTGKYVELDRSRYHSSDNTVEIFSGERIKVTGDQPEHDTLLSVRGYFTDTNTIHVSEFHAHGSVRDMGSIVGLVGILLIWMMALFKKRIVFEKNGQHERGVHAVS